MTRRRDKAKLFEPLKLTQLTPNVYWTLPNELTDRPAMGLITGPKNSMVVEGGNSPTHAEAFQKSIMDLDIPPLKYVAVTHWHWDHVFGASYFNLPVFAHEETAAKMVEMANLSWRDKALDQRVAEGLEIPFCRDMIRAEMSNAQRGRLHLRPPEIAFSTQATIDLDGMIIELVNVAGDHSSDSSVVYVPEDKVVFLGDCMYSNIYADPPHYTVEKLFPMLDRLLAFDAAYYIAAHGDQPLTRAEFEAWADELRQVGTTVEELNGDRQSVLKKLRPNGTPPDEDLLEMVDEFLAGLRQPVD